MRGYRSKLKAVKRAKKGGGTYWAARGFVPIRRADGSFARKRVEHGIGGDTAAARQAEVDRLNQGYEDRALKIPLTFAAAYKNYIDANFAVPLYAERILAHLGVRQCHEIDDSVMNEARTKLFEEQASPSYVNRHLYTPVCAILKMALKASPPITRPNGHKRVVAIKIPPQEWFKAVMSHMDPDTRALVAFLTVHGRRLGDALGRHPRDLDPDGARLDVGKTKTGDLLSVDLHPGVLGLLLSMPDWENRRWLFRNGPTSASNVRKAIQAACRAAGVEYFSPHSLGRHSFATRMLRAGYSVQYVKDAGGWATGEMVTRRYGHLERKEVTAAVHLVGDAFARSVGEDWASKIVPQISGPR